MRSRGGNSLALLATTALVLHVCVAVTTDMICPDALPRQNYTLVAEAYDLPVQNISQVNVTWFFNQSPEAVCTLNQRSCILIGSVFSNQTQFSFMEIGSNSNPALQISLSLPFYTSSDDGSYSIEWQFPNGQPIADACRVQSGQPQDECRLDPCVNATNCTDLQVGYNCDCINGFAGYGCSQGDRGLYCEFSSFGLKFSRQSDACSSEEISCYIAGLNPQVGISMSGRLIRSPRTPRQALGVSSSIAITGSVANITACITRGSPQGNYQFIYEFSSPRNEKRNFSLTLSVQITDENIPPRFNLPANISQVQHIYYIDVLESTNINEVIVYVNRSEISTCSYKDGCIQVIDFDFDKQVGAESLNASTTLVRPTPTPPSILFRKDETPVSLGYFYVTQNLVLQTQVAYNIEVTDGGGMSTLAGVLFTVKEVNTPPTCTTLSVQLTLDIPTPAGTNLTRINCSDSDQDSKHRQISYAVISSLFESYFRIYSDGTLQLRQDLKSLTPGDLTLNITARGYSDQPDPNYIITIPVTISLTQRAPAPKCNLTVENSPNTWAIGSVLELALNCDVFGIDALSAQEVNPSNMFSILKRQESISTYRFFASVVSYIPGYYTFSVESDLGGPATRSNVTVAIFNPPKFSQTVYNFTIKDTDPVITTVLLNSPASTDNGQAVLSYTVQGASTSNFTFQFTQSNDLVLASKPQRSVHNVRVSFEIEAEDSISGLTARARVNVRVIDENEPPTCIQDNTLSIPSDTLAGSTIHSISCTDPDITEENRKLVYSVNPATSLVRLRATENGEVILEEVLPLNMTSFSVRVVVSNKNFTESWTMQVSVTVVYCPSKTEELGIVFPATPVTGSVMVNCSNGYIGSVYGYCNLNKTWSPFDPRNCTRGDLEDLAKKLKDLLENSTKSTSAVITQAIADAAKQLNDSLAKSPDIYAGDIKLITDIINDSGELSKAHDDVLVRDDTYKIYLMVTDSLVVANLSEWQAALEEQPYAGSQMLIGTDDLTVSTLRNANITQPSRVPIVLRSVAVKRERSLRDIRFPNLSEQEYTDHEEWVLLSNHTAFLASESWAGIAGVSWYSVILYRNDGKFKFLTQNQINSSQDESVNSFVLSFSLNVKPEVLSPPLQLTFAALNENYSSPSCRFLDTSVGDDGKWLENGCKMTSFEDGHVACECNHLTNFAVLMSPKGFGDDEETLSIISAVGCGISIFCLLLTIIIYFIVWRFVKCDRSVLHIHLCVVLILAYIVFLAGVNRTENEAACKAVAILLHYLFLVVFFIMLSEGIELTKSVSFVFSAKSILWKLFILSYGVPVVIVAATLGITQTDGFGTDFTCWLSTEKNLIWAFLVPVLLVIVINLGILSHVLCTMQRTQHMKTKTAPQRAQSVTRTILMLSPLLGVTWVFGVLSVNEETKVFAYLFAIFNSLQGLFIFICYCIMPSQVRDGFAALRRQHRARSFDSGQRIVSTSNTTQRRQSDTESNSTGHQLYSPNTRPRSPSLTQGHSEFNGHANEGFVDGVGNGSGRNARPWHQDGNSDDSASYANQLETFSVLSVETPRNHPPGIYVNGAPHSPTGGMNSYGMQPREKDVLGERKRQGFGSSLKEKWRAFSRKRKNYDPANPEIEKNRLHEIYGDVSAMHPGQYKPAPTNSRAVERWKKAQKAVRSSDRGYPPNIHEDISNAPYGMQMPQKRYQTTGNLPFHGQFSGPSGVPEPQKDYDA